MKSKYFPPEVMASLDRVFDHGAVKHGLFGWHDLEADGPKGMHHQINKACGHIYQWQEVDDNDVDSGESHLAHAITRLVIALDMELRKNGPKRVEGAGEAVTQTSTVSDYIQKEVAAWKAKTGRNG
jgi:hypothetical protein